MISSGSFASTELSEYVVAEQIVRLFVHASRVVVGARDHDRHIDVWES